jgi:hypothetical protein
MEAEELVRQLDRQEGRRVKGQPVLTFLVVDGSTAPAAWVRWNRRRGRSVAHGSSARDAVAGLVGRLRAAAPVRAWSFRRLSELAGTTIPDEAAWGRRLRGTRNELLARARAAASVDVAVALEGILDEDPTVQGTDLRAATAMLRSCPEAAAGAPALLVHPSTRPIDDVQVLETLLTERPSVAAALLGPRSLVQTLRQARHDRLAQWLREGLIRQPKGSIRRPRPPSARPSTSGPARPERRQGDLSAALSRLASRGISGVPRDVVDAAWTRPSSPPPSAQGTSPGHVGRARSAAEAFLAEIFAVFPPTRGRFELNGTLDVRFGARRLEADFLFRQERVVLEVDGYRHFGEAGAYRRDRSKDLVLQRHGYLIMRILAEDVVTEIAALLDRLAQVLDERRPDRTHERRDTGTDAR